MAVPSLFARFTAWVRRKWQALRQPRAPFRAHRAHRRSRAAAPFDEWAFNTPFSRRHYKLFVPPEPPEMGTEVDAKPRPLLVMLHGCKQSPDDFATGTRMNTLAQERGWLVMYPEQIPRANGYRCWNWFRLRDQQRGHGEPALIVGMLRQVMQTHAVDATRVYVAGLSAGGAMAAVLAHTYPEVFAAVGVHSGLAHGVAQNMVSALTVMKHGPRSLPTSPPATPWVPLIVFHGDEDATVHPRTGEHLVAGLAVSEALPGGGRPPLVRRLMAIPGVSSPNTGWCSAAACVSGGDARAASPRRWPMPPRDAALLQQHPPR